MWLCWYPLKRFFHLFFFTDTVNHLFVANYQSISQIDYVTGSSKTHISFSYCHGLDFDYRYSITIGYSCIMQHLCTSFIRRNYIFWSDVVNNRILRARMNDTAATTLVSSGLGDPCKSSMLDWVHACTPAILQLNLFWATDGIAWDWVSENLYWTDQLNNVIEVYNPSTGARIVLASTGSGSDPVGIVLDPTTGYVLVLYSCSSMCSTWIKVFILHNYDF